jgi:hypothetical protein
MIGNYNRIDRVKLQSGREYVAWLLTGDNVGRDFEVLLTADNWFNTEFDVVERTLSVPVSTLQDVLDFCKKENIKAPLQHYDSESKTMLVGGEKDCIVYDNLDFDWDENAVADLIKEGAKLTFNGEPITVKEVTSFGFSYENSKGEELFCNTMFETVRRIKAC